MIGKLDPVMLNPADLPSFPPVIQKLESVICRATPDLHEVAAVIEVDQAFAARILKLVNSPFYGYTRRIVSVEEAITILGFNALHHLLLTTSLLGAFRTDTGILDAREFWRHSFGVGVLAKNLLRTTNTDVQNEVLMCGILHDIGRLVFARMDPQLFAWFYFGREMISGLDEETEHFGINHQDLGKTLAQKWNFPASITTTIANHHTPLDATESRLQVAAVNIANLLCHAMNVGSSGNKYVTDFYPEVWNLLGLSVRDLEPILHKSLDEIEKSEELFREFR